MLFNSYVFMLAFLPLTLLGYFLLGRLPEKNQLNKVFLVLASFLFTATTTRAMCRSLRAASSSITRSAS
ncbi:MAG: hypothetical protein ACLS7Z_08170 [Christensenellales bacterium]